MKNEKLTCTSYLNGKHSEEIEINVSLPYVSIYEYFSQGDDAEKVINEINEIYNSENCTPLEAVEKWASLML